MTTVLTPPLGHFTEVEGRRLWNHGAGTGSPAVIFVPGAGGFGLDFWLVHQRVAEVTTSILYDRAGTGWSDDNSLPRSATEVTDELRSFLRSGGIPGPYVLAGHSLGGLYVRRYAQRFPDEVAGLLLLDPAHEDWDLYLPEHLKIANNQPADEQLPDLPEAFVDQYRGVFGQLFAAFPEPLRLQLIDKHLGPERLLTGFREGSNVPTLFQELRNGGGQSGVPLLILSAGGIDSAQTMLVAESHLREHIAASRRLYDAVATTARGEHRTVADASHVSLPMTRPDAVAQAIEDLTRTYLIHGFNRTYV